jgi:multidrug efflux pump subunit AcrB
MAIKKKLAESVSYLNSLKFDTKLYSSIQARYISQIRFVILLIVSICLLGIVSFIQLPRRLNPEIKIPIVTVITALPGGTPEDIESLITIPLEDELNDIKGTDTLTSVSSENVSAITLQFTSDTDPDKARNDVDKAVSSVRDLPEDATDPSVSIVDFDDQPFWSFIIYTDHDDASLMRFGKRMEKALDALPKVGKVITAGYEKEYIQVLFSPEKLAEYELDPFSLSQAIKAQTHSYPAGSVKTQTSSYALAIDAQIQSVEDIRALRISSAGRSLNLGDIATISLQSRTDEPVSLFADADQEPSRSISYFVYKTSTADIDDAANDAKVVVERLLKEEDNRFKLKTTMNTADDIEKQFHELFGEFRSTLLLVFGLLFVFLGLRQAIIASLTIPLTFLSAFTIIKGMGLTLNFLTMFALLLSLGLLIDDTIVVVAAMTRYYKTGKFTAYQSAILVWKDFIVPLWSTTITTIWAFVPLLLATGIIGEFIKPIPIVVTATMLSSTSIATFITIPLMMIFLDLKVPARITRLMRYLIIAALIIGSAVLLPKTQVLVFTYVAALGVFYFGFLSRNLIKKWLLMRTKKQHKIMKPASVMMQKYSDSGIIQLEPLAAQYMKLIRSILRSPAKRKQTLLAILAFVLVAYVLVGVGLVKTEFFPKTDENILYVSLELPAGTSLAAINEESVRFANTLRSIPEATFTTVETGASFDSQMGRAQKNNAMLATLTFEDDTERDRSSQDIAESLRAELKNYPTGVVLVQELSGGPPAGADVQINLLGENLSTLNGIADDFTAYLEKQDGIVNPKRSIQSGTGKLVFTPDADALAEQGVSMSTIGMWLRTYASGIELDTLRQESDDLPIEWVFYETMKPEDIQSLSIPVRGGYIPLSALGSISLENNPTQITRENGQRTLSVYAGAAKGFNINQLNADLVKFAESYDLPEGYSWKTGGVNEENEKSVQSILQAMILSGLLILITMIIEFQSFRQAFLALLIIPVSIAGVFYIFGLTGIPLSFPALIGILALFGIVVTHAIVVIEKINDNRREGLSLENAIVDAAGNRLEPVVLTSLATIFGLIPITLADPLWQGLGGAIIAGLLFSGAIKLFLVPVLYYTFYKD